MQARKCYHGVICGRMADEMTGSELATVRVKVLSAEDLFQCLIRSPRQTFVECDEDDLKEQKNKKLFINFLYRLTFSGFLNVGNCKK